MVPYAHPPYISYRKSAAVETVPRDLKLVKRARQRRENGRGWGLGSYQSSHMSDKSGNLICVLERGSSVKDHPPSRNSAPANQWVLDDAVPQRQACIFIWRVMTERLSDTPLSRPSMVAVRCAGFLGSSLGGAGKLLPSLVKKTSP